MPISGCHDLPLATFNLPSRNDPQSNRKRIPQNKNLLVPSLLRRHACLTTPVVKPSPPQPPSVQTATAPPPPNQKPPRAVSPERVKKSRIEQPE